MVLGKNAETQERKTIFSQKKNTSLCLHKYGCIWEIVLVVGMYVPMF